MARYRGPKMKVCRRFGVPLWDKAERYFAKRDIQARRIRRRKEKEYGQRLEEKQKVKYFYGVLEKQFRRYFEMASRQSGNTGENLLVILERRLDNVVYRAGLAISREQARQMIVHGHIRVNGRKVTIPSFLIKPDMLVTSGRKEKSKEMLKMHLQLTESRHKPSWIDLEKEDERVRARINAYPVREEIEIPINEQLIVEFLSK